MEPVMAAMIAAGVALLLSLVSIVALFKNRSESSEHSEIEAAPRATRRMAEASTGEGAPEATMKLEATAPPEPDSASMRRFQVVSGKEIKQCLFVILDWPGLDTNRRLARLLNEHSARYDAKLGVYTIRAPRAGYKLTVANSLPPGTLPPIHEGDDQPTVAGVSILIHFINKRSVARNPETLIDLTQAIVKIGGHILDAERNAVSVEEFEQLRQHISTARA